MTRSDTTEGHFQTSGLNNSDVASSAVKREEHLAKIFDEILLQVFPKDPYHMLNNEARTAGRLITKRNMNEGISVTRNSPEPESFLDSVDEMRNDHISEETRDKEFSLFDRDVKVDKDEKDDKDELTTQTRETFQEAVNPEALSKSQPCGPLLHFLRKNIITAAIAVACILAIVVLLLLMLSAYLRRKRPVCPPANMTYNIFIMNGKTWWQKSEDKTLKKFRGKLKRLRNCSCV
ncbi:uncharacterized protein C2orf92 homolog [Thomomys bottae]